MQLSLNWLKEFIKYRQTPEQIAEILTQGGFEVEEVVRWGQGLEQVMVGQIKTIISHAEANKLSVCKVDVGRKQPLTIVCGARNVKPEQKVPVALVGATLPNGVKIESRRIRGIDSEGMLCAEDELKLGEDHSGILILDKDVKVGQKLGKATGLEDTVLNLSLTPNRPDVFSVIGLARELAALSEQKFVQKKVNVPASKKFSVKKLLSVRVQDYNLCPKYTARVVKNVKVKLSPQWLQARLIVSGIKPVNNIVDITNYVMLEYGQPLHAFDYAKVGGRKIAVRTAGQEKTFMTLDGVERRLAPDMLMIADSKQSIAMAGVMGGGNSEISKQTKDIVIESAIFKPVSVRRTRQRLGLVTEASSRFEKGIYWDLPELALDRAAQLMAEIAGGEVAKGMIVVSKQKAIKPSSIKVKLSYINNIIGRKFTLTEVKKMLEKLYFGVKEVSKDELKVTVPSFRQDVAIPADMAEEVGRMYGWNNLKPAPVYAELKPVRLPREKYWERKVKDALVACGMTETLNYSFYSQELLEQFGLRTKDHYQVKNPMNPEQDYMRISLVPRLLENVLKNYQTRDSIELFEVGHIFNKRIKGMPDERTVVSAIVYKGDKKEKPIQTLRGALDTLFGTANIPINKISYDYNREKGLYEEIKAEGKKIGRYGWIIDSGGKLGGRAVFFEIDMSVFLSCASIQKYYQTIPKYPAVEHDLTFIASAGTVYHDILKAIKEIDPLIVKVEGTKIYKEAEDKRSTTFRIVFQAPDRTLTSKEVEKVRHEIIQELANKFKMELKK